MSTQDENRCVVDGVEYVAVHDERNGAPCGGCVGDGKDLCIQLTHCARGLRQDKRTVIWVKAVDQQPTELERVKAERDELLEALSSLLTRYVELVNSGDAGYWDCETEAGVIQARAAIAKAQP